MKKEMVSIEFRYHDKPKSHLFSGSKDKTITIGIFDTLEEAIVEGNKALDVLAKSFEVRSDDRIVLKGLFGAPTKLVTNCCYPTKGIQYFAKIVTLKFDDLSETIYETFKAFDVYKEYKQAEQD